MTEKTEKTEGGAWGPAWMYGPGGEARIFHKKEDVPKGWADSPAKHKKAAAEPPAE